MKNNDNEILFVMMIVVTIAAATVILDIRQESKVEKNQTDIQAISHRIDIIDARLDCCDHGE